MAIETPVIASGGVSSVSDLMSLLSLVPSGVSGVIVGKALYTGDVSLKDAIRAVGPGRWQDVPPDLGTSAIALEHVLALDFVLLERFDFLAHRNQLSSQRLDFAF